MPELSVKQGNSNLTWALSNLGLADLFKPGFAQLFDVSDYKWLSVSGIIHKTHLDIKEDDTAAGHSSNVNSLTKSSVQSQSHVGGKLVPSLKQAGIADPEVINVNIDKPFVYFVFDNVSGLVMVMGKFGREPVNYRLPI